jgi:hypothetical protein
MAQLTTELRRATTVLLGNAGFITVGDGPVGPGIFEIITGVSRETYSAVLLNREQVERLIEVLQAAVDSREERENDT